MYIFHYIKILSLCIFKSNSDNIIMNILRIKNIELSMKIIKKLNLYDNIIKSLKIIDNDEFIISFIDLLKKNYYDIDDKFQVSLYLNKPPLWKSKRTIFVLEILPLLYQYNKGNNDNSHIESILTNIMRDISDPVSIFNIINDTVFIDYVISDSGNFISENSLQMNKDISKKYYEIYNILINTNVIGSLKNKVFSLISLDFNTINLMTIDEINRYKEVSFNWSKHLNEFEKSVIDLKLV
ncbi:hypothetical protein FPHOBKDP_00163 [Listeria phage LPJP1]|nr:hypothetical protein FPHOBKDP_00163 [Listeria phage LPJP1]